MTLRLTPLALTLAISAGLVAIPACKKSKFAPPASSSTEPSPSPGPAPGTGAGAREPGAPTTPVFSASHPQAAAMREASMMNAKQIGMGLHAFHDTNQALPAGYATKDGKPGLSWRVALLPYIEEENLFRQFKLDEPWDSPHNKSLVTKMPKLYAPPRQDTFGYTFYRGFTGPDTALQPRQATAKAGELLKGVSLTQITDGTSNTILVAEAYDPVIWTKPDELEFTPGSVPKLGGVFQAGAVVLLADGSVRFVRPSLPQKTLASAIQINDGQLVNWDE